MSEISLIITVFNRSNLLRKALLSLQNQSVKPDELILSDDGSSENIVAEISDIINKFNFPVKYVRQEHKGFRLAKVRNNAVKNSNGDYLIFLDQDLIYTADLIKTFVQNRKSKRFITGMPIWMSEERSKLILEDNILDSSFVDLVSEEEKGAIIKQFKKDRIYYYLHKLKLTNQPRLRGGFCAFNREDFYAVNGYNEKFVGWGAEDDEIGQRLYSIGLEGYNPFVDDYTIHLYHEKAKMDNKGITEQANYKYYQEQKKKIKAGEYESQFGLDNPFDEDTFEVKELN